MIELQIGVKAVIKKGNKYLLLRRNHPFPGQTDIKWDIPGGRINPGEELMVALAREIKEETDLEMKGTPKIIAAQDIMRVNLRHVVRLTYIVEAEGDITVNSDDHDEYKWFTKEELKNIPLDSYFSELLNQIH